MHAGRERDRGGNGYAVRLFGDAGSLHRLWDSELIDAARPWSAVEWATNINRRLNRTERHALEDGTPREWMEETVTSVHAIYAATPEGEYVGWPYLNMYEPLVERRFTEAGYRLDRILNEIFGR